VLLVRLSGLVSHARRRTFMSNGTGVSRGDRNRNARLAGLRMLVPVSNAIVGIDLADAKQMVVVTDHDSKVLARKTFRCRAWDLGAALDWAAELAAAKGWAGVTVACEPTGHRWRVLGQLAADRSMPFVCVQPMLTSWARRSEDLTFDKTDKLTELWRGVWQLRATGADRGLYVGWPWSQKRTGRGICPGWWLVCVGRWSALGIFSSRIGSLTHKGS